MSEEQAARSGPTLAAALRGTFDPAHSADDFALRLVRLAQAITNATDAHLVSEGKADVLASAPEGAALGSQILEWVNQETPDGHEAMEPRETRGALAISVALPGGAGANLVVRLGAAGATTRALTYERLVALSRLSVVAFRHPDLVGLNGLLAALKSPDADPEALSSRIRAFVDADLVALAEFDDDDLVSLALSDQPQASSRASTPERIELELRKALEPGEESPGLHVARGLNRAIALKADNARRNADLLPILTYAIASSQPVSDARKRKKHAQLVRRACYLLAAIGIALVPVPDARRVPAEVIATETRTITAPFSGVVLEVSVADGGAVIAGETELARLDTSGIVQELAGAQADYARVLLERETARAVANATELRTAELEAESLRARIDRLEARRESAQIMAPIGGVVVGGEIDTIVGATVRQGDPLMRVVDPRDLALRLEIPDDLLTRIDTDETGLFRPDFAPGQGFEGAVIRISPAQDTRSDLAVFEGRATLPDDTGPLRPGLRGVFIFERQFRPIWRIVHDAARNWFLLRVWP